MIYGPFCISNAVAGPMAISSYTWTTGISADWAVAGDWTPAGPPNTAFVPVIIDAAPAAGSYTVTIASGETFAVGPVTLNNAGATLAIAGALNLNGDALAVQHGGVVLNSGTLINIGTLTGLVSGTGVLRGAVTLDNQGTIAGTAGNSFILAPFVNQGTVSVSGTGGSFFGIEGPSFANLVNGTLTGGTYTATGLGTTYNILGIAVNASTSRITTDAAVIILDGAASDLRGFNNGSFEALGSELQTITSAGALVLLDSRGFTDTNTLTAGGYLGLGGGTLSSLGLTVSGLLQGYGIVNGAVVNAGVIDADGGALDITSPITGTGQINVETTSTLIVSGATVSSMSDNGVLYDTTGLLDIAAIAGGGTLVVQNGATIELQGAASQAVTFGGANATLRLDDPAGFSGTLTGFGPADRTFGADRLVLGGVSYTNATIVNGNTLAVTGGGAPLDYRLSGDWTGASFSVVDTGGSTVIEALAGGPVRSGLAANVTLSDQAGVGTGNEALVLNDLNLALASWGQYVTGHAPLRISLTISSSAPGAELANGGYGGAINTGVTIGSQRIWEPAAIYALETGSYLPGVTADINITLFAPGGSLANLFLDPTSDGTGAVPALEYDLTSVFRHELAHGLGFIGFTNPNTGVASNDVMMFDHYISKVLNNGTIQSASFTGPNAEAAYAALIGAASPTPVPLTTLPNGEALFHVANALSDPLGADLLNGVGLSSGVSIPISAVDLAMMEDIGLPVTAGIVCYARGTRIMTQAGEVPVEALRVDDVVVTPDGRAVPVSWVGRRRIDCRKHPAPHEVSPVRIRAHAFGEAVPARDLLVSPNHAIAFEDVLIPARLLVDGISVDRPEVDSIEYFHVELPAHDLLLAEGLAAESYLDCGDRAMFSNGGRVTTLFPNLAATWECAGCRALKLVGPEIARARAFLAEQAGRRAEQPGERVRA